MGRCRWLRRPGGLLLILLAGAMAAHGQAPPPMLAAPSNAGPADKLLADFDQSQRNLQHSVWVVYAGTAALGRDARGKTIADDLDAWVMTPSVRAQLQSLRTQAEQLLQAGDVRGARSALASAEATLEEQNRRLALISGYRTAQLLLDRQRALWTQWLTDAPADVASASKARISQLESALSQDYSPDMSLTALSSELEGLKQAYNDERLKLAGIVSQQRIAKGKVIAARDRTLPCPEPVKDPGAPTDSPVPRFASPVATDAFYPRDAQRAGISGRVILELTVSALGCMTHAEVNRSSGSLELDSAAMDVAEHLSYFPARKQGQPVEGRFEAAFTFVDEGPSLDDPEAVRRDAGERLSRGDDDGALADLDPLIRQNPKDAAALAERGWAHLRKEQAELARADLDRALALDPRNVVALRARGTLALESGDFAGSIADFTAALKIQPQDLYSVEWRTEAARRSGQTDQALAYNAAAMHAWPSRPDLYLMAALILRTQHKTDAAVSQADALLKASPESPAAYSAAGRIYAASGRNAEALRAFDQVVALSPTEASYLERAAYRPLTDLAGRKADIDAALRLNPRSPDAARALIEVQADAGDYAAVLDTASQTLKTYSRSDLFLTYRGLAYLKTHEDVLGAADLDQARAKATTAFLLNDLCWSLATADVALGRAASACEAAVAADPIDSSYRDSLAFVLLRLGRYADSLNAYNQALKTNPEQVESLYGRGLVLWHLGEKAAAASDFSAALALDARVADRFAISYGLAAPSTAHAAARQSAVEH